MHRGLLGQADSLAQMSNPYQNRQKNIPTQIELAKMKKHLLARDNKIDYSLRKENSQFKHSSLKAKMSRDEFRQLQGIYESRVEAEQAQHSSINHVGHCHISKSRD